MVARDNGTHFVARRVRSRRFFRTARRPDDKLVASKNQFGRNILARPFVGVLE